VPGGRLAMPRPALYDRRVHTEGQPNPYPYPSRPLDEYAGREPAKTTGLPIAQGGETEIGTALTVFRHSSTVEAKDATCLGPLSRDSSALHRPLLP
jgi:hypothetical protein